MAQQDLSPTIRAIIGEAAGEGPEGMLRVAKVILTRADQRRLHPDEIVMQPRQFSAMARPDLEQFIAKQPPSVVRDAHAALEEATKTWNPHRPYATHYMTTALHQSPKRPAWANRMKVVERYGGHVFLNE